MPKSILTTNAASPRRRLGTAAFSIATVLALGTLFAAPAQANDETSGPVTISGQTVVGETLTALEGTWDYGTEFTYQWFQVDSAGNTDTILGAQSASYDLTELDLGYAYAVGVSGTVGPEESGVTIDSEPTGVVTSAVVIVPELEPVDNSNATAVISGTPVVGNVLTTTTTGWPEGTVLTYEWGYNGGQFGGGIDGATSSTYTVTDEFVGLTIVSIVTGSLEGYEPSTVFSTTDALVTAPQVAAAAAPVADSTALAAYLAAQDVTVATQESAGLPAGSLNPGQAHTATVDWFSGDSFVDVYAYSTPTLVGTFPVIDGKVQIVLSPAMLSSLAAGTHTLVITGQSSGAVQAVAFSISKTLAATGVNPMLPLGSAALLLLLGAALVIVRRRRALV